MSNPTNFNGSYGSHGSAPKANEDLSKGYRNDNEQNGAGYDFPRDNAHSGLQWSFLPCPGNKRVEHIKPNKSTCHLWNTPQCGYGCGTCAGSDSCYNYPYLFKPNKGGQGPAPVCTMNLSGGGKVNKKANKQQRVRKAVSQNGGAYPCLTQNCGDVNATRPTHLNETGMWYSQQCQCSGKENCGNCAGSGTVHGCGCGTPTGACKVACPIEPVQTGGGGKCGGGGACQDCNYYYDKQQSYRHMLSGKLYPFC